MKVIKSLPARLFAGIIIGILLGFILPAGAMEIVVTIKYILSQLITFSVPLIIIGFIAPSIAKLGNNVTKMLSVAVVAAYASSVLAAAMSMAAGYALIPHLSIASHMENLRELPEVAFQLDIPQIMPVMSALVFSLFIGLATVWTKAERINEILQE
ncbi:MAG: cation:dicarboxylase symporter family transporter, partial [Clostridia bacterium]|nr:cation:dicarboxylase symporter family transporter [Clostridia bacterium]